MLIDEDQAQLFAAWPPLGESCSEAQLLTMLLCWKSHSPPLWADVQRQPQKP
jgi:hypothetical protein